MLQLSALNEKDQAPVTAHQGQLLAQQIKGARRARARADVSHALLCGAAVKYVECSAISMHNVSAVFDDAVRARLNRKFRAKAAMMSFSSGRCCAM